MEGWRVSQGADGVMEGLIRADGVMEGLIREGGVMEGLISDRWSDGGTHKGQME